MTLFMVNHLFVHAVRLLPDVHSLLSPPSFPSSVVSSLHQFERSLSKACCVFKSFGIEIRVSHDLQKLAGPLPYF